jgi:hypothetical protein
MDVKNTAERKKVRYEIELKSAVGSAFVVQVTEACLGYTFRQFPK